MLKGRLWQRRFAPGLLLLIPCWFILVVRHADVWCLPLTLMALIFALPGWLWAPKIAKIHESPDREVWGALMGLLFTSAWAGLFSRVTGVSLGISALVGTALATIAWFFWGRPQKTPDSDKKKARRPTQDVDLIHLVSLGALLAVLSLVLPYEAVGRKTDAGFAYRHWFQNDFFNHMALSEELAHGTLPPVNPYFAPDSLAYYWLFQVFPASVLDLAGKGAPCEKILLGYGFLLASLFGASLTLILRAREERRASLLAVAVGLFAYNYQGTIVALRSLFLSLQGTPFLLALPFKDIGILTHPVFQGVMQPGIESLFKQLLYSQQHLVSLLAILLVMASREARREGLAYGVCDGLWIGIAAAFSSFMGLLGALWLLSASGWQMARGRSRRSLEYGFGALAALGLCLLLWQFMGMGSKGFPLVVRPAMQSIVRLPVFLFLSLGPAFVFLLLCSREGWQKVGREMWLLAGICICLILLLEYGPLPGSLSNKTGFASRVPVLMATCLFFSGYRRWRVSWGISLGILALGIPVFLITLALHSKVSFPGGGSLVSASDKKACAWIRENVPETDVVQPLPDYYGEPSSYALVSVFAGRRQAMGDVHHACLFGPSPPEVMARRDQVMRMFTTGSVEEAWGIARGLGIRWVYVGPMERNCLQLSTPIFETNLQLFHRRYSEDDGVLYEVASGD